MKRTKQNWVQERKRWLAGTGVCFVWGSQRKPLISGYLCSTNPPLPAPTVGFLYTAHSLPVHSPHSWLMTLYLPLWGQKTKNEHHSPLTSKATEPGVKQKGFEKRCGLA